MNSTNKQYGLVVCGGLSTRMGMDKSMLDYHGMPQRYYLYELLENICDEVFISCNKHQAATIPSKYNKIVDADKYTEIGPMAALLSAFEAHPECSFLTVGCDYPFIDKAHLIQLIGQAQHTEYGASYYNPESIHYEPLLSDYHYTIKNYLQQQFSKKNYSIQQVLKQLDMKRVTPEDLKILTSVDTKETYEQAKRQLSNS